MTDVFADPSVATPEPIVELVGEGKKFKTVEDLAKGKLEADKFIETLKAEMAELRSHLEGQTKLDELKQEIQELRALKEGQPKPHTGDALSAADITALVKKAITDDETTRTATQNIREANAQMVSQFGTLEKAQEVLQNRALELGLSVKTLQGIASQSPTAFVQMVAGKTENQSETIVRHGTVNTTTNLTSQAPKEGTWEYFENIKKTKGINAYFHPSIQNALHKAVFAGTCKVPSAA